VDEANKHVCHTCDDGNNVTLNDIKRLMI